MDRAPFAEARCPHQRQRSRYGGRGLLAHQQPRPARTEIEVPKPAGTFRIICLGDESTLAPDTASAETFCARLRVLLAATCPMDVEVINAGCPQYGPLLSLILLKQSLLCLSPDLVICHFDMSDIADDHRCRRSVRMKGSQPLYCPHPELERQRLAGERLWVERLLMWQHAKHGVAYLLGSEDRPEDGRDIDAPQGMYAWLRDDPPDWSVYIGQTLDVIGQMSSVCRRSNCQFLLSAIPSPWQISAEAASGPGVRTRFGIEEHVLYKSRFPYTTLLAYARKEGILFCDPSMIFKRVKQPERLFRRNVPRFSATGHELYARILGRFVEQRISGPWRSGTPHHSGSQLGMSAAEGPATSRESASQPVRRTSFNRERESSLSEKGADDGRSRGEGNEPAGERAGNVIGQGERGRGETR